MSLGRVRVELSEAGVPHEFEISEREEQAVLDVPEPGGLRVLLAPAAVLEASAFRYAVSKMLDKAFERGGDVTLEHIGRGELELACPEGSLQVWVFSDDAVFSGQAEVEWGQTVDVHLERVEDPR